jgi:AcrR family transcriptional regulator
MPRAGLSTDAVVDVALALVDEKGVEALSLAAVADRAGVAAPSLYKHVGSLAALRDLMAVKVMRQMTGIFTGVIMGRSGDEAVAALMRAYRAFVLAHPGRYALLPLDPLHRNERDPQQRDELHRDGIAEASREMLDVFIAVMRGYGLEASAATHAIRRLRATVHGFADLEIGGGFGLPEDIDETYHGLIDMVLRSLR